ncbi:UNVERIFIED_CONTAM: hypothetical protein FKN15_068336 [Acipenser sinensis]
MSHDSEVGVRGICHDNAISDSAQRQHRTEHSAARADTGNSDIQLHNLVEPPSHR